MPELSRRSLLGTTAAAGAVAALGSATPGTAAAATGAGTKPHNFPDHIELYNEVFRNWDGVIHTDPLWTCAPASPGDVVELANWARANGYRLRPRGYKHSWSPLVVEQNQTGDARILIVDTTKYLTSVSLASEREVRAQAGTRMDSLLDFLHRHGKSLVNVPAPGDVTVAGVLAVNAHGTSIPARGEQRKPGQNFGTVSNLVTEMTAVVWDGARNRYVERTFDRADPACAALLTSLGRLFITEVKLQICADYQLRCQCFTDIPATELFAHPAKATGRSLSNLLDESGRVGLIWYTFTDRPWVQQWTVTPEKPLFAKEVSGPYNFLFADNLPSPVPEMLGGMISGNDWMAPGFGNAVLAATDVGLTVTGARDMWGPAKNFINFVKPTTLKVSAGSHAVVTSRAAVQRVVHEFSEFFTKALKRYEARHQYPVNSCVEIRVTGIDDPAESIVPGAQIPALSSARPVAGHPEWDTVVWLDALTLPGTPHEYEFYAEMDAFVRTNYANYASVRPEWSKRWATTSRGPWTDESVLRGYLPRVFDQLPATRALFGELDPARVFTNDLLGRVGI
ncbi:cholesterol oxidase substrate-binding domain-containing protein [Sciscionella sediminilitoris]|uniref:cholesterol oxidase substrate-binding domain-containing protein n=1 Tax=Sciscionella sediminilitoris TaxID=1445613 RepID=UPI000567CA43|nr:cholesterol oxidase substrate-binding domain-containing protein [Sciscionella sp. SE31]